MSYSGQIDLADREQLKSKQQRIYECIIRYQRLHGFAPTIRELCGMLGLASTSSIYGHLKNLERKGYIARKTESSRAIAIL